jgi:hypothetical protein
MDKLEQEIKQFCFQAPRWMQIELQAFWYGFLCWSLTCAEENLPIHLNRPTLSEMLETSHAEFGSWPTDWLSEIPEKFLSQKLTFQQQQDWFQRLEHIFQDCVPSDLNIFTELADGSELSEEQMERLYTTVAFEPPQLHPQGKPARPNKTLRPRQRRGITPIRRLKVMTRHHKTTIIVSKIGS